jgi:hypothetical protein
MKELEPAPAGGGPLGRLVSLDFVIAVSLLTESPWRCMLSNNIAHRCASGRPLQ